MRPKKKKKKKAGILALLSEKGTQRDSLWLSVILFKFRYFCAFVVFCLLGSFWI